MELSDKDLENVRAGSFSSEVGKEMFKKVEHSPEYTDDMLKKIEHSPEYTDDMLKKVEHSPEYTDDMLKKVVTGVPREEAIKNLEGLKNSLVDANNKGFGRH